MEEIKKVAAFFAAFPEIRMTKVADETGVSYHSLRRMIVEGTTPRLTPSESDALAAWVKTYAHKVGLEAKKLTK